MDEFVIYIFNGVVLPLGVEGISVFLLLFCFAAILCLWKWWGANGLYLYNILAVVIANIQVLKTTPFIFTNEHVALGTLLFATTFTVSDILTEHKGSPAAHLGVKLSFTAQIIVTILMIITLLYPAEGGLKGMAENGSVINPVEYSMYVLFAPSVRILIASLSAYYISQLCDIYLFKLIKEATHKKFLWLRFNVANMLAGLLDNILFSTLAWVVLSPEPVSFNTLVFTYIFATYAARVVVSLASTPVMYLSYKFK